MIYLKCLALFYQTFNVICFLGSPFLAAKTELNVSGVLEPMAKIVMPVTVDGTPTTTPAMITNDNFKSLGIFTLSLWVI